MRSEINSDNEKPQAEAASVWGLPFPGGIVPVGVGSTRPQRIMDYLAQEV